jgi:hypothetical protein
VDVSKQIMASTSDYVSASYSVLKLQGRYYMISQDIGFLTCGYGRDIFSWESDHPEGPFTNKKLLYTIEDKYRSEYMITYNATAHPEFIKNNELLISYNVNGACTPYCEDPFANRYNADLYRPKFIRVPLDYIDPALNVPDPVYPIESPVTGAEEEEFFSVRLEVYPNPATGRITIEIGEVYLSPNATITVKTATGQQVLKQEITQSLYTIDLAKGLYFIQLHAKKDLEMKKLIVH